MINPSSRDEILTGGAIMCNFNFNCNSLWAMLCRMFGFGC